MKSLILGFSVVFPLFIYMAVGYIIKSKNWISDKTVDEMNKLVFNVFMAITLFLNAYNVEKDVLLEPEHLMLAALALGFVFVIITVTNFVCNSLKVTKERKAIFIQAAYRSNIALFGLSVNTTIYGEGNSGFLAIMIAILIPFYNIISVYLYSSAGASGKKVSIKKVIINVIKNPLIIGSLLGLGFTLVDIKLPVLLVTTLRDMSRVTTPLAFILLGAGIVFGNMAKNKVALICAASTKLVIVPTTILIISVLLCYREQALVAILCCFASPAAVSINTMSVEENVEPEFAGEVVAVTTVMSIVTIFFYISGLSYFNLM